MDFTYNADSKKVMDSDSTPEYEKKTDKKIALLDIKLFNLKKKMLSNLKKKRRLDLLFEVTLKE